MPLLRELLAEVGAANTMPHAVTMTAEVADCFATKAEGVRRILDSVLAIAGERVVLVWQTAGEFVSADLATEFPRLVAAANWHALATWGDVVDSLLPER